jgi:sRNA-binding carbon storage regulator CsrA
MKKVFKLTDPKKAPARQVDTVKHEINKYIARERKKKVTDGVDFWDFDCKVGINADEAKVVHISEINKSIDALATAENESFYIEILAKPGHRTHKTKK